MKYSSSSLSNDEQGLIDAAGMLSGLMRKVRKKSAMSAIGICGDSHRQPVWAICGNGYLKKSP